MTFGDGAWRGGLVGAVGGGLSYIGGSGMSFASNLLLETTFGNMTSREGLNSPSTYKEETFTFDNQNRLLTYTVGSNTMTLTYDSEGKGNINTKTDVGTYNYSTSYLHQIDEITSPSTIMQNLPRQDISYTKFNKVSTISITDTDTGLDKDLTITYGPDQLRVKTVLEDNSSTVLTKYYALGMYEKEVHTTEGTRELYYINTPSGISAILESTSSYDSIFYIHIDILGSYDVITDDQGGIRERLSFDPWGRRRNTSSWDYTGVPASFKFDRGFTGHEHLDDFCLINMNGRVYDPIIAMFLSPDKYVQSPENTQNLNRYSYVLNNPLKYTDPSGDWFFSVLLGLGGGYLGGVISNDGEYNPTKWDASVITLTGVLNGLMLGFSLGSIADDAINNLLTKDLRWAIKDINVQEYNAKFSSTGSTDFPYFTQEGGLIRSDETLKAFSDRYFSKFKYKDRVLNIYDNSKFTGDASKYAAWTNPIPSDNVYSIFYSNKAFGSMRILYRSMGHEYIHIAHLIEFLHVKTNISEFAAYNWNAMVYYSAGMSETGDAYKRIALENLFGTDTYNKLYPQNTVLKLQPKTQSALRKYLTYREWGVMPFFPIF